MEAMVELRKVSKEYPLGKLTVRALAEMDLCIGKGEFTVVAGPSGSGKTTLLNMVGCVDVPSSGEVLIEGQPTSRLKDRARTKLRLHKLGFIFQTFNLIPVLTAEQNVEFPLLLQGELSRAERRARVREMLELVGLGALVRQRPNEMSGGQRQRVAIARALVSLPHIVLADEPTANLDTATGLTIIELMKKLNRERQTTFIFSTHDPRVMEHARRIVRIVDGRIEGDATCGGSA
ncbi:MAG TPA: ABC transporter ATP-binding protein [Myxococcota bacterium]|nr:ABC transporter ATP-binding protein [Myxococcota bacterium]HRY97179.1 ABC transporter ATP-binding protein [Myxococcota bacterium]HSA21131.1 ABC transporter ATP-binding protein [Myxococcota bacterium]